MATGAERKRRWRLHRRGDHRACLPSSCALAGRAPVTFVPQYLPLDVGPRPWDELTPDVVWENLSPSLGPVQRVMLTELLRIQKRLDQIDATLNQPGRSWVHLGLTRSGRRTLRMDTLLAEGRQHALALRSLTAALVAASPTPPRRATPGPAPARRAQPRTGWQRQR